MLAAVVFFLLFLISGSEEYPMYYASCLVSCSVVWRCPCSSACPLFVQRFGLLQPLLFRVFHIAPWDSLSGLCVLWDSLSSFPSLLLGRCILGWPVWPVIGFPLLGVHQSISIVKLIVISYHSNCLEGQLNC